jgi:hypothetical protein
MPTIGNAEELINDPGDSFEMVYGRRIALLDQRAAKIDVGQRAQ